MRFFAPDELILLFVFVKIEPLDHISGQEERPAFFPPGITYYHEFKCSSSHDIPSFPLLYAGMTNRKCYELIGNSLNVMVVAHVLQYMFGSPGGCVESHRHRRNADILIAESTPNPNTA